MITEFLLTLTFRWKSVQGKDLDGVKGKSHENILQVEENFDLVQGD